MNHNGIGFLFKQYPLNFHSFAEWRASLLTLFVTLPLECDEFGSEWICRLLSLPGQMWYGTSNVTTGAKGWNQWYGFNLEVTVGECAEVARSYGRRCSGIKIVIINGPVVIDHAH
jgi:hypothetical protein